MEPLILSQDEIDTLLKGGDGFTMPSIKQPNSATKAPKIGKIPGISPPKQKSAIKQIEQMKTPEVKEKKMEAAKEFLKFNEAGQWSLEKGAAAQLESPAPKDEGPKYHIHTDGHRITSAPLSLKHIDKQFGGVKKLEAAGHKLVLAE